MNAKKKIFGLFKKAVSQDYPYIYLKLGIAFAVSGNEMFVAEISGQNAEEFGFESDGVYDISLFQDRVNKLEELEVPEAYHDVICLSLKIYEPKGYIKTSLDLARFFNNNVPFDFGTNLCKEYLKNPVVIETCGDYVHLATNFDNGGKIIETHCYIVGGKDDSEH